MVTISFSVGSGTGPETRAPVRLAVSTMRSADWSMRWCSYALSLMRIFWLAIRFPPIKSQQFLGCLLYCFFATHQFGFKSFPL